MQPFENAKWIWLAEGESPDSYAEFKESFPYEGGSARLFLSSGTDYALFVGGVFVSSGQYGDFEHYKSYDKIDLTPYLSVGENEILLLAYHCGVNTSRYRKANAGVIYSLRANGVEVLASRAGVPSRLSPRYASGRQVYVSRQLGFTFHYDATANANAPFSPAAEVEKACRFVARPVPKGKLLPPVPMTEVVNHSPYHYLIDLGGEVVGLPTLTLLTDEEQTLTFAWGEHVTDGGVRREVGGRHFLFTYRAHAGKNEFTERMLRIGCRYVEVFSEKPFTLLYAGVLPQVIPVTDAPVTVVGEDERRIYDACLKTLHLCMMEHYVDCPWREQALYAFDSRNQMLCGYDAFVDGNAAYARACLALMSEDTRPDGLLSICYPAGSPLAIPSFSLHYIIAMKEYLANTGDTRLARKYFGKMTSVLSVFLGNREESGLVCSFDTPGAWNFYDWSAHLDGAFEKGAVRRADAVINSLTVMALDAFADICLALGKRDPFHGEAEKIRQESRVFFTVDGLVSLYKDERVLTSLAAALAVSAGVAAEEEKRFLCDEIVKGTLSACSLSLKVLLYTALLDTDTARYRDFVLGEIRDGYLPMIEAGPGTVWETVLGESDFENAGSLCHGWSAVPVHVYHRLGVAVSD